MHLVTRAQLAATMNTECKLNSNESAEIYTQAGKLRCRSMPHEVWRVISPVKMRDESNVLRSTMSKLRTWTADAPYGSTSYNVSLRKRSFFLHMHGYTCDLTDEGVRFPPWFIYLRYIMMYMVCSFERYVNLRSRKVYTGVSDRGWAEEAPVESKPPLDEYMHGKVKCMSKNNGIAKPWGLCWSGLLQSASKPEFRKMFERLHYEYAIHFASRSRLCWRSEVMDPRYH